jgi:hypothetical protein
MSQLVRTTFYVLLLLNSQRAVGWFSNYLSRLEIVTYSPGCTASNRHQSSDICRAVWDAHHTSLAEPVERLATHGAQMKPEPCSYIANKKSEEVPGLAPGSGIRKKRKNLGEKEDA